MKLHDKKPSFEGKMNWLQVEDVKEKPEKRLTLIQFWSLSCMLCKKNFKEFESLHEQYKDKVEFISIHIPRMAEDNDASAIKACIKEYNFTHSVYNDNELLLSKSFDNKCVPTFYLFDRDDELRFYQAGASNLKMIEARINRLL